MTKNLTAVSLFSGCGGFDLGAQKAGVDIIWANDIDAHAAAAYQQLFNDTEFVLGDIREIRHFPQAEVLIGCYPCTGFSGASRRRASGKETRDLAANSTNFLFREYLRALREVRPKYLFVENVRGMRSAQSGWFLQEQLRGFQDCGYDVEYQILDASDYGAAQARKRLFIVGVHRDVASFTYEFPLPTHGKSQATRHQVLQDVIQGMDEWPHGEFLDYKFHGHYLTRNRKRRWDEPSYTIVADAHHVPLHPMGEPMTYIEKDTWALQGTANRRLSWRECALIQGLPSHTEPSGNLEDKYRVIGNSVPPVFGKALLEPIIEFERSL